MGDTGYYPTGAQNDPNAPYNEPITPKRNFNVTISQTLSKDVVVKTDQYKTEYDAEDNCSCVNTEDTNWSEEYAKQHYTPLKLIKIFKEYLKIKLKEHMELDESRLNANVFAWDRTKTRLEHLIQECEGWTEDEIEIFEN